MNAIAKAALAKVAALKATEQSAPTVARGLVSLFDGLASIEPRVRSLFHGLFVDVSNPENSLFPGFIGLVQYDAKQTMVAARESRREVRKSARALRRERRAALRIATGRVIDPTAVFNFGILRCRGNRKGDSFRVTFRIAAV